MKLARPDTERPVATVNSLALGAALALAFLGCLAAGCADSSPDPGAWLRVRRVQPDYELAGLGRGRVFLNQPIVVQFDAAIDPMSINRDTVKVLDADGRAVPGRLERGRQSVRFVPQVATRPDLSDGSFRPDQTYRLVVVGLPAGNAVRSATGAWLEATAVHEFRAVPADVSEFGYPTPFLADSTQLAGPAAKGFGLLDDRPKVPVGAKVLRVYLTHEPDPRTVLPEAFHVYRSTRQDALVKVPPIDVRLRRLPVALGSVSVCALELEFAEPPLGDVNDLLFVQFVAEPGAVLRDYSAQPIEVAGGFVRVDAYAGQRFPLWSVDFSGATGVRLESMPGADIGFEQDGARLTPRVRRDAGAGSMGALRPLRDLEIHPRRGFDPGDGMIRRSMGTEFAFQSIDIPPGVTVTFVGDGSHPLVLRVSNSVRIRGTLRIRNVAVGQPRSQVEWLSSVSSVTEAVAAAIVAGGDIKVGGTSPAAGARILVEGQRRGRCGLALIAGGRFEMAGELPADTVLGTDNPDRVVPGVVSSVRVLVDMPRELPPGVRSLRAAAVTEWFRLPQYQLEPILVAADHDPGIRVQVQIADPDPMNPARPSPLAEHRSVPAVLPLAEPLDVPPGAFVRFILRGDVGAGELPEVRRLAIESR